MSAMDNMLKGVLQSMIPPEVMALITPENMAKLQTNAKAFVDGINEKLDAANSKLEMLLDQESNDDDIKEILEYVRSQRDSKPGRGVANKPPSGS